MDCNPDRHPDPPVFLVRRAARRQQRAGRRLLLAALVGSALLPLLGGCGGADAESTAPAPPPPVEVRTLTLASERLVDRVSLPADLLPLRRATLAAEVPGTVESILVEEGQTVSAGARLLMIDRATLRQSLAEAEAVALQREQQLERANNLFERRSVTRAQQLDAVAANDVAKAQLAFAQLQLQKSELRAPWAGMVSRRLVEVGDFVPVGQPLIVLVDTRTLKVRAPVPAADLAQLSVGMSVELRVDSLPGEDFPGKVERLAAELDPQTRTLDVEVLIDNRDGRLRPGMPARLEVPRRTIEDALMVPLDSLVELENGNVVYLVEGGQARRRPVVVGPLIGDRVVIEDGLSAADRVIVEGQRLVAEGQEVREVGRS